MFSGGVPLFLSFIRRINYEITESVTMQNKQKYVDTWVLVQVHAVPSAINKRIADISVSQPPMFQHRIPDLDAQIGCDHRTFRKQHKEDVATLLA